MSQFPIPPLPHPYYSALVSQVDSVELVEVTGKQQLLPRKDFELHFAPTQATGCDASKLTLRLRAKTADSARDWIQVRALNIDIQCTIAKYM